jgi:hypothetical protein
LLPCRIGDTVFIIDSADCKSGECLDVDTDVCKFSLGKGYTKEVFACKRNHLLVREVYVDEININISDDGFDDNGDGLVEVVITINDYIEIESKDDIYYTWEEAEKALKERANEQD